MLTGAQKELVAGYIYHRLEIKKPVDNKQVRRWVEDTLGVTIGYSTLCKVVKELGFKPKKPRRKKNGNKFTADELGKMHYNFLTAEVHPLLPSTPRSKIASIDFTYTSCKNDAQPKLGVRGGCVAIPHSFPLISNLFLGFFVTSTVVNHLQQRARLATPTAS